MVWLFIRKEVVIMERNKKKRIGNDVEELVTQ